jgi:hypothetical protein
MKINWKVLIASVLVVATLYWVLDSFRERSYSGGNLTFSIGSGPVTVTNQSEAPIPVQIVGTGSRTFTVSSEVEGVAGTSTRQGTGLGATQLYEFELPQGLTEFAVVRGTDVNFVATTDTSLEATVKSINANDARTTLIAAVVVILGSLFYISSTTGHRWLNIIRRKPTLVQESKPIVEQPTGGQGRAARPYGDNRTKEPN